MSNKKVYLAKNTLASGFDVEYVKSHLLRIPGIVLIESGMSIGPVDCAAFVIVPDNGFDLNSEKANLSKNVTQELEIFLNEYGGEDNPEDCVYIYSREKDTDEFGDVEETFPLALSNNYLEINYKKKENYDKYSSVELDRDDEYELIQQVSSIIESQGWQTVPRHFAPPVQYAVPGVPSIEERKLKTISASMVITDFSKTTLDKRLLLLRR